MGVGTEYALFGGWSVKSEYLYATSARSTTPTSASRRGTLNASTTDVKMHEYIYRFGMNYRFDWASWGKGKAPVVAKY